VNSRRHETEAKGNGLPQDLYLYLWSSVLAITLEFVFNTYMFSGSLRASTTLFRDIIHNVMRMPILWLDTTPIGEMLRIFTVSARMVDDTVLITMNEFADQLVKLLTIVSVG
jgi:ABC-type multidrug transport system fused ATPase/permease subunit